jgi:transcriptional regulator with XRE-family HTH domain
MTRQVERERNAKRGDETIGQRLARIRKECGYTQVELAARIGIIQSLISDYERDVLRLTAEMAVRFALALDVTTDELLHPTKARPNGTNKPSLKVLRRMQQIERLPPNRQALVLKTIDAFVRASER